MCKNTVHTVTESFYVDISTRIIEFYASALNIALYAASYYLRESFVFTNIINNVIMMVWI